MQAYIALSSPSCTVNDSSCSITLGSSTKAFPISTKKEKQKKHQQQHRIYQRRPACATLSNEDPPRLPTTSSSSSSCSSIVGRNNLFLLDVPPLCYRGSRPSPSALIGWLRPFFSKITRTAPIIAVIDGERGNEYRKGLLPTYKAGRRAYVPLPLSIARQTWEGDDADLREAWPFIRMFLLSCHIPVLRQEYAEADDVVASLTARAVEKGLRVTIASPDKDFRQLLSEDVQIVAPLADLNRWSFYTHKVYIDHHGYDPETELSLRCLLGDKVDRIPGLAEFVPGFGRKTALKLLKKHGSLERLLQEASVRTVGRSYVQGALTKHASILWKNFEVLRLRRDLPIRLLDEWCAARDTSNDEAAFVELEQHLNALQRERAQKDGVKTRSFSERTYVRGFQSKPLKKLTNVKVFYSPE